MRTPLFFLLMISSISGFSQTSYLFVGTYTNTGSKGIYVYRFNADSGKAEFVSNTDSIANPSYLVPSPDGKFLYSVSETGGQRKGSVQAFAFDAESGKLSPINQQLSGGDGPCYVTITKDGKWVIVGNYSGGSLSLLPVAADGSLQPYQQTIQHTGSSVNKNRQEKPHVHSTILSPDEKFLFTPDLGLDKVMIYSFSPASKNPLAPAAQPFAKTEGGSGPRHFTFHPNKKWAYVIEELTGTVTAFTYNNGKLTYLQRLAAHPQDFRGTIGSADIHVSPDGKFLYASNRGDENTITIFSVNGRTGKLTVKGYQPTLGKTPRNFMIDKTGNYLLVANQETNNIVIFKRDKGSGLLQATGNGIEVPKPVCLKMME